MSDKIQWLSNESFLWEKDGIIDSEQREKILSRYPEKNPADKLSLPTIFIAILGILCIGVGIILVISYNWNIFPIPLRLAFAFILLLSGEAAVFFVWQRKREHVAFSEGAGLYLCLTVYGTMALIGQIFHLKSSLSEYLFLCALMILPAIYLANLKAASVLYSLSAIIVICSWRPSSLDSLNEDYKASIILLLILPYIFYLLFTRKSRWLLGLFLVILGGLFSAYLFYLDGVWGDGDQCLFMAVLLLCDILFRFKNPLAYFQSPLKLLAIFAVSLYSFILSFQVVNGYGYESTPPSGADAVMIILFIACLGGYGWLRYRLYQRERLTALCAGDLFLACSLLLLLIYFVPSLDMLSVPIILGTGLYYIIEGGRKLSFRKVNYGAVMIVIFVMIVLFSSDSDLLGRGAFLILVGAAFLGLNITLSRKRRSVKIEISS